MTTERKLIEKQKELINLLYPSEFDDNYSIEVDYDYAEVLQSEIDSLESELAKEQEPEGVTAEEIMKDLPYQSDDNDEKWYCAEDIIEAMESYAKSKQINRRDELLKYEKFCGTYFDDSDELIDRYLKSK